MKKFWRCIKAVMVLFFVAGVVIALASYAAIDVWKSRVHVEVDIAQGLSGRAIGHVLADAHVIRTPTIFALWVRLAGLSGKLRAGYYEFGPGMTLRDIADKIARGEVKSFSFTIIEGWTIKDISAVLVKQPFVEGTDIVERFEHLVHDPEFTAALGFPGLRSLEGYLFPDTYLVSRPKSAEEILRQLVARFREVYTPEFADLAKAMGLTDHQVITLASIVEKETGQTEERPIIASVFLNRLKVGMPLQSDPTVIYGLPHFNGNLRKQDLSNPHSYNTYVHGGLPPGPICAPSKASIDAVLHPAETNFLYFVSRGDGTHEFTATISEHLRAVMKYQIAPVQH